MIFKPDAVKLILQSKKTMTRRPADGWKEKHCRYQTGRVYRVQPSRGKAGVCSITITDTRRETLGEISIRDAQREGYRTRYEFVEDWIATYGHYGEDSPVWVISFVLGVAVDEPRLLAARPGAPHGDYTNKSFLAADGEPEALTESELVPYVAQAHSRDEDRRRKLRAEMALSDRVMDIQQRALNGEPEAQRAMFVIKQRVEKAERAECREKAA